MIERYILFVMSAPVDGQEADYNDWQDHQHLPDICAIPGIKSARRFQASEASPITPPQPYATIYEIETDDPAGVIQTIKARSASGEIVVSDALDRSSTSLWLMKALPSTESNIAE